MADPLEDAHGDPPPDGIDRTTWYVRRAIDGDAPSLEWTVQRLTPLLLDLARYRIGNALRGAVEPEDLVQEAWAVTLPRLVDLEPHRGRMTPVLLRFLSTVILNQVRTLQRRLLRGTLPDAHHSAVVRQPDRGSGAVEEALRSEARHEVRAALERLTGSDREVILLRGVEGQSNAAVGAVTGLTPAAVSKRYTRAIARLRQTLPDSIFDELDDPEPAAD